MTNVVLLTVDSLRADHVEAELTPNLVSRAENGLRFERAYANGFSTPVSFPTILTGTYADHYGGWEYMSDRRPFLAATLEEAGFSTVAFHANPHLRAGTNYGTGFDYYNDFDDEAGRLSQLRYLLTRTLDNDSLVYRGLRRAYHFFRTSSGSADYAQAPQLNDRVFRWLDTEWEEEPLFLWVHYMDVHYPFYPPDRFVEGRGERAVSTQQALRANDLMHGDPGSLTDQDVDALRRLYRGEVRYMDHYLGELFDGLDERGLTDDTAFFVTSDHGELFGEYGLFGHPPTAYDESLHVPLAAFGPGVPEGRTVEEAIDLCSLPPTIADAVDAEADPRWERASVLPGDGDGPPHEPFVLGDRRVLAAQADGLRLIYWREVDCPTHLERRRELVDLERSEAVPVEDHLDVVDELDGAIEEYVRRIEETDESLPTPEADDAVQDRLEALGYK